MLLFTLKVNMNRKFELVKEEIITVTSTTAVNLTPGGPYSFSTFVPLSISQPVVRAEVQVQDNEVRYLFNSIPTDASGWKKAPVDCNIIIGKPMDQSEVGTVRFIAETGVAKLVVKYYVEIPEYIF